MSKTQRLTPLISLSDYSQHLLMWLGFMTLLLVSNPSFALTTIPNQCTNDTQLGVLTTTDYNNIISSYASSTNSGAAITQSGSLNIKMTKINSPINNVPTLFRTTTVGSNSAINISQTLSDTVRPPTAYGDIKLSFTSNSTSEKVYLNQVALNVFDVDRTVAQTTTNPTTGLAYSNFDDAIIITGESQNGTIDGTFQQGLGGAVIELDAGRYRIGDITKNCPAQDLGSQCQASFKFAEPVSSVTVRYTNSNRLRPIAQSSTGVIDPTTEQQIDIRLDSYCYKQPQPSYTIAKNDNVSSITTGSPTDYVIKITNTGQTVLNNIILKDPIVSGLAKQSNIRCDGSDANNTCNSTSPILPTVAQLQSTTGFNLPAIPIGKTYSIIVPTTVTAAANTSVTNTATISSTGMDTKSATDTNSVTASTNTGGTPANPGICPIGDQLYYVGAKTPNGTTAQTRLPLSAWTTGSNNQTFTFANGTALNLSFSALLDLNTGFPAYVTSESTNSLANAIMLKHNSNYAAINHRLIGTVNRPVTKFGFIVQDIDTFTGWTYAETLSIDSPGGIISNINTNILVASDNKRTVSAIDAPDKNCNRSTAGSSCDINIDWLGKAANTPFSITHGNISSYATPSNPNVETHIVGYSDFYFCLPPTDYTFTGYVFNDNGGIAENNGTNPTTNTNSDVSSTFAGNQTYFNGLFDSSESGISAAGLTVSLTNCAGTPISGTTAQTVASSPLGQFKFTVPANVITSLANQKVCLVQNEPSGWDFSVDTTLNTREVNLVTGTFDYKTESNGSRNLDFGEVKANYAALVLKKSQYVHTCTSTLDFTTVAANPQPDTAINGFSATVASDVIPGQCIAYRIEAFNRGHIDLQKVQMIDKLQTTPIVSFFSPSRPLGVPQNVYASTKPTPIYGQNGTIVSSEFDLVKVPTGSNAPTKATLFFNTKYGTRADQSFNYTIVSVVTFTACRN